ncbi:UdgX family uracil-DNA binding protein [Sphingosinithalassobacter sp. CS137]|uniref:UdgX family uracil-DNA binding protein n=1 Tax=Sphingosinithalassobacter sp. CS137 TaxID=2762748 RepID=UPI00165D5A5F|nr:UdgX family uracil-DNA binding protein [Sphingosinithalassobacter sp. CS137]
MRVATLSAEDDYEGWRAAARTLAGAGVAAEEVVWRVDGAASDDLFAGERIATEPAVGRFRVPRVFPDLAETAVLHSDPERFALLYALLLRLRETPKLLEDSADPLVRRVEGLARAVQRDLHKMRAFLRFREVEEEDRKRYVAWFEPEHHIVRRNARFFVDRFASMRWSILTPELSLHWDGNILREGPGASRADAPEEDPIEAVWKTYYAAIFNPARLKPGAMLKEMPRRYWKNMPETALVPELMKGARARESGMIEATPAAAGGNLQAAWEALRNEAASCTRCPLYKHATQTVFGEGPISARMMLVGEQPGDQEDLAGRPFVGPAGQMLDRALEAAGVDRSETYVTNAVKHFKFEPRGKRRIHAKPDAGEIEACRWWIEQETMLLRPEITVALGATAARALLGRTVTIGRERGRPLDLPGGGRGWITVHPSYLLRIPDKARAADEFERFVDDLKGARTLLA